MSRRGWCHWVAGCGLFPYTKWVEYLHKSRILLYSKRIPLYSRNTAEYNGIQRNTPPCRCIPFWPVFPPVLPWLEQNTRIKKYTFQKYSKIQHRIHVFYVFPNTVYSIANLCVFCKCILMCIPSVFQVYSECIPCSPSTHAPP